MANANDIAKNAMSSIQSGGQALTDEQKRKAAADETRRQQSADYLNTIEDPMAQGNGGYSADESAAIQNTGGLQSLSQQAGGIGPSADFLANQQMSPEEQQRLVTSAGITAGAGAQAAKDTVGRATAATGGNPMALGAYRARLDRQGAGEAADAMTQARVAASNAAATRSANAEQMRENGLTTQTGLQSNLENEGSTRAKSVGDTRLGTQQSALNYYQGQNAQADTDANNADNRQQQTYQTQTGGTTSAANTGVNASQTPGTFDKILGAASGAIGGLTKFIEDGDFLSDGPDFLSSGTDAVVGENGPEKVVQADGSGGLPMNSGGMDHGVQPVKAQPFWKQLLQKAKQNQQQSAQLPSRGPSGGQQARPWSPVDTYTNLGKAVGQVAGAVGDKYMADGGMAPDGGDAPMAPAGARRGMQPMNRPAYSGPQPQSFARRGIFMADGGIITKPTRVHLDPGEAVVPLNYRPGAKIRPSMAALPAARARQPFGGARA